MPDTVLIDERTLSSAVDELSAAHGEIQGIISLYGRPPLWGREPGFASLVYTILEQQVSLASARAVYRKLEGLIGPVSPRKLTAVDTAALREIGFSRQKTDYCRNLADLIITGELDLDTLEDATDAEVMSTLMKVKGIGPWTATIYLLHSLKRPDIWPAGDLALRIAFQEAAGLPQRPSEEELERIGVKYAPWRSVAARVFWHSYLSKRNIRLS